MKFFIWHRGMCVPRFDEQPTRFTSVADAVRSLGIGYKESQWTRTPDGLYHPRPIVRQLINEWGFDAIVAPAVRHPRPAVDPDDVHPCPLDADAARYDVVAALVYEQWVEGNDGRPTVPFDEIPEAGRHVWRHRGALAVSDLVDKLT